MVKYSQLRHLAALTALITLLFALSSARALDDPTAEGPASMLSMKGSEPAKTPARPAAGGMKQTMAAQELEKTGTTEETPVDDAKAVRPEVGGGIKPFGYDFFDRSTKGFEPIPENPAPAEYPLGSGDKLRVIFTSPAGDETDLELQVDQSGRVRIPNVGFVRVSGMPIASAERAIARAAAAKFPSLKAQASVMSIRPIQVFLVGEVNKPGAYVLPGLSTLLNALYAAGGPNLTGSLRTITVERNKKKITEVDLYDLLLYGKRERDITLNSGDSIFVPAAGPTVTIQGEVRRPAIYELLGAADVRKAIAMAGGVTGRASLDTVRVERVVGASRKFLMDLALASPDASDWNFVLQNGDDIKVRPVTDDAVNRVQIEGPVQRPGDYELSGGLTVSGLVKRAEGFSIQEQVYLDRATIHRARPDGGTDLLSVNLGQAMSGENGQDVQLKARDRVIIYTLDEAAFLTRTVTISGEVSRPGMYDRKDGMCLRDLIVAAGGARPEAYASIEIARMQEDGTSTQVLTANLDRAMAGGEKDNLLLADRDHVSVRNVRDARRAADVVEMKGEVKYPGFYPLLSKDERLSSVIARAGGLTEAAFPEGTIFNRQTLILLAEPQVQTAAEIQHSLKALTDQVRELEMAKYGVTAKSQPVVTTGTGAAAAAAGVAKAATAAADPKAPLPESASQTHRAVEDVTKTSRLPVDLSAGLKTPGGEEDVILQNGDTVQIPRKPVVVSVAGAVVNPSVVAYRPGLGIEDYVHKVGGYARDADRKNTVVVRANGYVARQSEAKTVNLGDIIIVPARVMTASKSRFEVISDFARVVANLAVAVAVTRN